MNGTVDFRALHVRGTPLLIPNAWDVGSARILEGLGHRAIATTSSGFALTLGRSDYGVTRDDAIDHGGAIAAAVGVPVSADLEDGFGSSPEEVAATIRRAAATGLAGGSIEDTTGDPTAPIHERSLAVERVAAAAEAARRGPRDFVLTARAEGFLWEQGDLDEVVARLVAFAAAGADVLYAPGLPDLDAVTTVCAAVDKPVNVLAIGALATHSVAELAAAGAARISLGGALAFSAYGSLVATADAILQEGRFDSLRTNLDGARRLRGWLR